MTEPAASPESQRWLRPELLRSWTEFLLVSALLIAMPIHNSTVGALHGSSNHYIALLLDDRHMLGSIFWEAILLALFLFYAHWRGWRPADFRIHLGWWTSAQGVGLLLLAWGAAMVTLIVLIGLAFELQPVHRSLISFLVSISPKIAPGTIHLSWTPMLVAMIVNAFLEELIFMGYIFNQLAARRGPLVALLVTIFLRAACHTYQDPMHLAGIGVLFTVFALWYWATRQLWPLIFAHILLDVGSCTFVKVIFG